MLSAAMLSAVMPFSVNAKEVCTSLYGGGEECKTVDEPSEISIDKKIYNPKNGSYVDSMVSSDYKFDVDDTVTFQIKITNNGDDKLNSVTLKDELPYGVDYKSYKSDDVEGNPSVEGRNVSFKLGSLDSGESKKIIVTAVLENSSVLPKDKSLCLTNWAYGSAVDEDKNKLSEKDSADYCYVLPEGPAVLGGSMVIAREVERPKALPETGPELGLGVSATFAIAGAALKKIFKS